MKGDISADFHAPEKRYSGVRGQQGRVLTDADFNAAFDTVDESLRALIREFICAAGTAGKGLEISGAGTATEPMTTGPDIETIDFSIADGSFVLGGRPLLLSDPQTFLDQEDWLSQRLRLVPDTYPAQPTVATLGAAPGGQRHDLVYLEMVERPVRAVEDREIQERALGGADTTTRLRPQLRFRVSADTSDDCATAAEGLRADIATANSHFSDDGTELLSDARLQIEFVDDAPADDPCAPREIAGYLGAENQMLKVMLTAPDSFVWAFDHGEPLYRITVDGPASEIEFLTEPRDPVLYPRPGQVIEILPWDVLLPNKEKAAAPTGFLMPLSTEYDPSTSRIGFSGLLPTGPEAWLAAAPPHWLSDEDNPRYFYARIWQQPPSGAGVDEPTGAAVVLPGTGLSLNFISDGVRGDYWSAALRPETPEVIVPWQLQQATGAPPIGPRRFYAPLALITWEVVAGAVVNTVTDCRNKFRRLCRIKNCCSYQVGDGRQSFGDFDSIQLAINALPTAGGEICLLPGRHEGVVDTNGGSNIRIHGCGRRTTVSNAAAETDPVFTLTGGENITLEDFDIEHDNGLVIAGSSSPGNVTLRSLGMTVTGSAIRFTSSGDLLIEHCIIRSREFAVALDTTTVETLRSMIFIKGTNVIVRENVIEADFASGESTRIALGGLQIAGESENVQVLDNRIAGGNGNGITLGSIATESRPPDGESGGFELPPPIIVSPDGCIVIDPGGGGTVIEPGQPVEVIVSEGPVENLRIRNNDILDMGMSGISVVHWFVPPTSDSASESDDIEIHDADIAENTIRRCMRRSLAGSLPLDLAFSSGYGGIVLAAVEDLQIEDNDIRDCGTAESRTALCGIYLRYGEIIHIADNRIYDNGRAATFSDPLLVGNIGGIVISMVEAGLDVLSGAAEADTRGPQPRVPALFVKDNIVVSPEGRALDVVGTGPMHIEGNSLTCYGNNGIGIILALFFVILIRMFAGESFSEIMADESILGQFEAFKSQLGGSAVSVVNQSYPATLPGTFYYRNQLLHAAAAAGAANKLFEINSIVLGGELLFNDNIVVFDALSSAQTLSTSSVLLAGLDDVAVHDNQSTVEVREDFVLINTLALGLLSLRVQGNRFKETVRRTDNPIFPSSTLFSAATFGFLNATENNQGTHCFYRQGNKKPQVLIDNSSGTPVAFLDTNRHFISESACRRFLENNLIDGIQPFGYEFGRLPEGFADP